MPFKETVERYPVHDRQIECKGYERKDGLWDIEGYLIDIKHYDFANTDRGIVKSGEKYHEMGVKITIDSDMFIKDIEAFIEYSPFKICPGSIVNFKKLIGLQIKAGFKKEISTILNGVCGCTHLKELLFAASTVAFQTVLKKRHNEDTKEARKPLINTCFAFNSKEEVVKNYFPEMYDGE